jgi:RNA polymerase sigma factor (sigma-70 family)
MKGMNHDLNSEILERLRRRDEAVLPVLLTRYGVRIAATVRGTWHGIADSDVEEVVASVMADAWFRAAEVDLDRGSLESWLVMRARYGTLDHLRAARRGRSLLSRVIGSSRSAATMPDYPSDLDAYLAGLTDLDRTLVQFRFVEGRPVAEVAAACGLTTKAAEHRLARLRNRLRERCVAATEIGETSHA